MTRNESSIPEDSIWQDICGSANLSLMANHVTINNNRRNKSRRGKRQNDKRKSEINIEDTEYAKSNATVDGSAQNELMSTPNVSGPYKVKSNVRGLEATNSKNGQSENRKKSNQINVKESKDEFHLNIPLRGLGSASVATNETNIKANTSDKYSGNQGNNNNNNNNNRRKPVDDNNINNYNDRNVVEDIKKVDMVSYREARETVMKRKHIVEKGPTYTTGPTNKNTKVDNKNNHSNAEQKSTIDHLLSYFSSAVNTNDTSDTPTPQSNLKSVPETDPSTNMDEEDGGSEQKVDGNDDKDVFFTATDNETETETLPYPARLIMHSTLDPIPLLSQLGVVAMSTYLVL